MKLLITFLCLSFAASAQKSDVQNTSTERIYCTSDGVKYKLGSSTSRNITELSVIGKGLFEGLPSTFEPNDLVPVETKYVTPLFQENLKLTGENLFYEKKLMKLLLKCLKWLGKIK